MEYSTVARRRLAIFTQASERLKGILLPFVNIQKRKEFVSRFNELVNKTKEKRRAIYDRMEKELHRVHVEFGDLYPLIRDGALRAPTDREFLAGLLQRLDEDIQAADAHLRLVFAECSKLDEQCEEEFSRALQEIAATYAGLSNPLTDKR
jgi:hypothetical protein